MYICIYSIFVFGQTNNAILKLHFLQQFISIGNLVDVIRTLVYIYKYEYLPVVTSALIFTEEESWGGFIVK
jgi:hypothetical protein